MHRRGTSACRRAHVDAQRVPVATSVLASSPCHSHLPGLDMAGSIKQHLPRFRPPTCSSIRLLHITHTHTHTHTHTYTHTQTHTHTHTHTAHTNRHRLLTGGDENTGGEFVQLIWVRLCLQLRLFQLRALFPGLSVCAYACVGGCGCVLACG
jgi:hypothetical protein